MKTHQNKNRFLGHVTGAGVILALLLTVSPQSLTSAFAQDASQTTNDIDKNSESEPMCPMCQKKMEEMKKMKMMKGKKNDGGKSKPD